MEKFSEAVYDTMIGQMLPAFCVPGVENLFSEGRECERAYEQMLEAYGRLRRRLDSGEEDADCEIIIDSLMTIQRKLALAMFRKGYEFGQNGCQLHLTIQ